MIIVKTPGINGLSKTQGCRNAGNAIISDLKEKRFLDFEEIHVNSSNLEEQETLIYKNSLETMQINDRIVFLGGDHSISFPIGKAFLKYCQEKNKKPFLIVFDAHADCMPHMKEPTHEEWLRALIDNRFPKENIILIGARDIENEEKYYLEINKINKITVQEIKTDINKVLKQIIEKIKDKELYISFDIDIFDSSVVQATGYPSSNGLNEFQVSTILKEITKINKPKVFDLVEVNLDKSDVKKTLEIAKEILEIII